jgi:hypothetical protein
MTQEKASKVDPITFGSNPWAPENPNQFLAELETDELPEEFSLGRKRRREQEGVESNHDDKRARSEIENADTWGDFESFDGLTSHDNVQHIQVHRVHCDVHNGHPITVYTDRPRLFKGDNKVTALRGRHEIREDIFSEEFALDNPLVSFAVVKEYDCGHYYEDQIPRDSFRTIEMPRNIAKKLTALRSQLSFLEYDGPEAMPTAERIYPIAQELKETIEGLERLDPHSLGLNGHDLSPIGQNIDMIRPQLGEFEADQESLLTAPYLGIYHMRSLLKDKVLQRPNAERDQRNYAESLVDYVLGAFAHEYKEADDQFARGIVTKRHLPKLFALGDIIVQMTDQGPIGLAVSKIVLSQEHAVRLNCWGLEFDGQFYKKKVIVDVSWRSKEEQISIDSLEFFPLRFADEAFKIRMLTRGEQFWQCRDRRLIECDSLTTNFEFQTVSKT